MSHSSRTESPTKIYHVYGRGVDKKEIFKTAQEKNYFMKCMFEVKNLYGISVYAYCIMPNHYHLILEGELTNIGGFMRNCQGRYGLTYNTYHHRDGHVFQGKYKSKIVFTEGYFWSLIRYIHLNPIKAHLVDTPSCYRWSSYSDYLQSDYQKTPLSAKAFAMVKRHFPDLDNFMLFHNCSDHELFDDVEEDITLQKLNLSILAKEQVNKTYGIDSWTDVWKHTECRLDIVNLLMNDFHCSMKEVSMMFSVSQYKIQKAIYEDNVNEL